MQTVAHSARHVYIYNKGYADELFIFYFFVFRMQFLISNAGLDYSKSSGDSTTYLSFSINRNRKSTINFSQR